MTFGHQYRSTQFNSDYAIVKGELQSNPKLMITLFVRIITIRFPWIMRSLMSSSQNLVASNGN